MRRKAGGGRPEEEEQRSGGWTIHAHMRMHNHDMHMEAMRKCAQEEDGALVP